MIPANSGAGTSFSGCLEYLTHDPKAQSQERVEWTHTLNLAEDHLPSAVNLMYLTVENAELLKQQAGIRAGGRPLEYPVKHWSLNWAPGEKPSKEHMIHTAEDFLRHMMWHEHQAVLVAHNDKEYSHVHIMLNAVHPETGLRLNDSNENRRAQEWALKYEREHGIHCEQRLENENEREKSEPRNTWMAGKAAQQVAVSAEKDRKKNLAEYPENQQSREWKLLYQYQKNERVAFWDGTSRAYKEASAEAYREVRDEFKGKWSSFYDWKKRGNLKADELAKMKEQLIADRDAALENRRTKAFKELREDRDDWYKDILDEHREAKAELRHLQEYKLDTTEFMQEQRRRDPTLDVGMAFADAAVEVGGRLDPPKPERKAYEQMVSSWIPREPKEADSPHERSRDAIGHSLVLFADALFFDLTNLGSARPVPLSAEERADRSREAGENTLKQEQQRSREEEDVAWRSRQQSFGRE